mgnify:CR=1 FL=1
MKSYEKALEELKAKYVAQAHAVGVLRTFIDACEYAPASARNEFKAVIKRLKVFSEGKTYQEYLEGLNDESND